MSTQLANHPRGSQAGQSITSKDTKGSQVGQSIAGGEFPQLRDRHPPHPREIFP